MKTRTSRLMTLLAVPILCMLAGCLSIHADIKIKNKDEIAVSIAIGILKNMAASAGMPEGDSCGKFNTQSGAKLADIKLEPYSNGEYIGCKISGKLAEGIPDLEITFANDVWTLHVGRGFLGGGLSEEGLPEGMSLDTLINDFKMSVTFPGKVLTHNGSSKVSGNTVTWTDVSDLVSPEGLKATGSNKKSIFSSDMLLWIGIAVAAILVLGIIIFIMVKMNKANSSQLDNPESGMTMSQAPSDNAGGPVGQSPYAGSGGQADVPGYPPGEYPQTNPASFTSGSYPTDQGTAPFAPNPSPQADPNTTNDRPTEK